MGNPDTTTIDKKWDACLFTIHVIPVIVRSQLAIDVERAERRARGNRKVFSLLKWTKDDVPKVRLDPEL
jgi:hypothetical protein